MSKLPPGAAWTRSRPALWLAFALLCCWPLAGFVPPAWTVENGVIENAQVLALAAGCASAAWLARRATLRPDALLAACMVPAWTILIGRELSWGAVFLPPTGMVDGVALYSSRYLWYKPAVAPLIALALLAVVATVLRHRLGRRAVQLLKQQPALGPLLLTAIAAGVAAGCAEGHLGCSLPIGAARAMALEELLELVAYGALVACQWAGLRTRPAPLMTPAAASRPS